ncbi:MAG: methyltransferase [Chloroflexota bacterium]
MSPQQLEDDRGDHRSGGATGDITGDGSTARQRLAQHLNAGIPRHLVYVAAKLGLAEVLADGPRSSGELAAALGAHPDTLRRLMRGMVAIGLLTEADDGQFALDEMGYLLRSDPPEPLLGRLIKSVELGMAWGGLLHAVRTGETPFEHVFGEGTFTHFARHPAVAALGSQVNPGSWWEVAQAIAGAYEFSPFETVVDVGGGNGIVLTAILQRYPHLRGAVLDQPHLMEDTRKVMTHYGVDARTQLVPGDFFEGVPQGDVYVLKTILHDWDDARAARILERCRQAMSPRGRVVVVERLLPERAAQGAGGFLGDVMMLVETGGQERTEGEFCALFAAAGLALTDIRPLQADRYAGRYLIVGMPTLSC